MERGLALKTKSNRKNKLHMGTISINELIVFKFILIYNLFECDNSDKRFIQYYFLICAFEASGLASMKNDKHRFYNSGDTYFSKRRYLRRHWVWIVGEFSFKFLSFDEAYFLHMLIRVRMFCFVFFFFRVCVSF